MTVPVGPVASARLRGLDGMRALAVVAVILFHFAPGLLPGGALGVDVFFVISGFLITGLLVRERDETGRIHLGDFWRRRARRLLPALGVLLLVCTAVAVALGGDIVVGLVWQLLGAATFSSNWIAIANGASYFGADNPELFRNLWSLAVEEQFYLAWPLLLLVLLLVRRRGWRVAILAAIAVASAGAMAALYSPSAVTRVYYGTDTHVFGLALGALLAVLAVDWPQTRLGWARATRRILPLIGMVALLALVAIAVLLPSDAALTYRGGLAVASALAAIAIVGAIVPGSLLGWLLERAPLRFLGVRSYGLYLWHWPVFVLLGVAEPEWRGTPIGDWAIFGVALVVTVLAASLSYRFVEEPIRRRGFRATVAWWFRSGPRRSLRIAGAVAVVCLVAGGGGFAGIGVTSAPNTVTAERYVRAGQSAIASAGNPPTQAPSPTGTPGTGTPGAGSPTATPVPSPSPTSGTTGRDILAIGDSVMLAAAPGLQSRFPGIAINAVVSRQMRALPGLVASMARHHALRPLLVVGLGTNGSIGRESLEQVLGVLGPDRRMVVVNVQAPRPWTDGVNRTLEAFADSHRSVVIADWHRDIAPHIGILAPDHIHPGPTGGRIYATAVSDAVTRLEHLPPLEDPSRTGGPRVPR